MPEILELPSPQQFLPLLTEESELLSQSPKVVKEEKEVAIQGCINGGKGGEGGRVVRIGADLKNIMIIRVSKMMKFMTKPEVTLNTQ